MLKGENLGRKSLDVLDGCSRCAENVARPHHLRIDIDELEVHNLASHGPRERLSFDFDAFDRCYFAVRPCNHLVPRLIT